MMKPEVRPLAGLKVIDLGVGMAAALAAKLLVDAGADVTRFEPPNGDPFYDVYPAYRIWQQGKTIGAQSPSSISSALDAADLCLHGGEDYPGLAWRRDARELRASRPRLVVLDFTAAPANAPGGSFPAVELFAQARSGISFEHFSDKPIAFAFPLASYGCAFHGVAAAMAALLARDASGRGEHVQVSLLRAALRWGGGIWADVERPSDSFKALIPKDVVPLRFLCADDVHIHITPGVPGTYEKIYAVLGIPGPTHTTNARGTPVGGVHPSRYFGDVALMSQYARKRPSREILEGMWEKQLAVEEVLRQGGCWSDPQTIHNDVIRRTADGWEHVGNVIAMSPPVPTESAGATARGAKGAGPLAGLRIVDLGNFAAGPHSSVILGDLGAAVIKIERPDGDPMRAGMHHFAASSRGKRSIAIDAKSPEGQEIVRRVCASADIVHHNFRPGVSARLGVDAATLKQVKPSIIVLESLAYGPTGPKAMQSGFDSCFQALCGLESFPGGEDTADPINYRIPIADYGTASLGAVAMMFALWQKRCGRVSSGIFTSLLNGGIFMGSEVVRTPAGEFVGAPVFDDQHLGAHPAESIYRTADGWVAVAARGDAMSSRFARSVGAAEVADVPRGHWGARELAALRAKLVGRSTNELLAVFAANDIWAVECERDMSNPLRSEWAGKAGMVFTDSDATFGATRQIGRAVEFSETSLPTAGRGMLDGIGGHTREILAECGYPQAEIDDLFARKIVG